MKNLSVVFLLFKEIDKTFVLLGKQAFGKKMSGIRNGFGGKCEYVVNENREETTLECAKRELKEEAGIDAASKDFFKIGNMVNGDKSVDFFVVATENRAKLADNSEFVDMLWFDLEKPEMFLSDMLSGDYVIIEELQKYVSNPKGYIEFKINKTGDEVLNTQTRNIFS
jgi:8-oxo-dGTP pyrophosphatase MutT (NUDIX family)